MKKYSAKKTAKGILVSALAALTGLSSLPMGVSAAADSLSQESLPSYIKKVEGVKADYEEYLDSSVVFKLPDTIKADDEISVIVTLDNVSIMDAYKGSDKTMSLKDYSDTAEAENLRQSIKASKESFLQSLDENNISYKTGEDYSTVLGGFEVLIKASDFESASKNLKSGMNVIVGEEYRTCETQLVENEVNVYDTGIFKSDYSGYDGSGMVVAVLDTGLDSNHTAFSVDNFTSEKLGLTYEDVKAVIDDTAAAELLEGLTVDDVYINEKVPYGFDYADSDPDVYSTHNNHGTHVSGVIVGNDDTIRGVAPNAQLVSMKIFSDVMDTARTAWILAALEDCVVLGVDVINMSIGTACGFSRESDEEAVDGIYEKIRESGISMVVAASNSYSSAYGSEANGNLALTSNPDTGTVGSPSTYEGVMSVASIAGVETPYIKYGNTIIYFTESTNSAAEENEFCNTLLGDKDSVNLEYVVVPGVGRSADYTGLDVKGKIALVRRGSNTFEEKAIIAQEQGAAGIIIYNNVSGDIKMNVGDATLAVCSISQDDGEMLASKNGGKLKISRSQTSGPFISDFSSWGPTPDLRIKPEITAHGGSILSSITGGGYDRLSGTSMACPNLSGVVLLLRQYVVENFPEIAEDNLKVNSMVNSLLMSTADIALNTNGLPYSVRKQGAGLANLSSSTETPAYIKTFDKEGNVMDKPKLEVGDDKDRTGVYEMSFAVTNFGKKAVTYDIGAYIFTEGVSETKTNAGETTINEEAYILEGAKLEVVSVENGRISGTKLRVKKGEEAKVTVKITLSKEDKQYLDKSFENGMYVEGFITLTAKSGTDVNLNVPYLAYYGDWCEAPLFDLTYYDTNADELDEGIDAEDKTMADAYASRPIGGISDDYVSYLGSYYFLQDPDDMDIPANEDYVSLSNQLGTIHSLRFVWAGLLRNAAKINITITDDITGEVIFEKEELDVRKSYSDGGASIYPSNVEIEFDASEFNLDNNKKYTVRLEALVDYDEGGLDTNKNNVFEFPLYSDFEAPTLTNVEFRTEYDKTLKKNRLYADAYIYDNHYTMASQVGYIAEEEDENGNLTPAMKAFEQFMTPVYSERNSTTKVTFELTDYIYDIKENGINKNTLAIGVYDYALNYATFEVELPDNFTDFYFDIPEEGLTLNVNEVYTLEPVVTPADQWSELISYSSSRPGVVRVVNNKIVAVSSGTATVKAQDLASGKTVTFTVNVLGDEDEGYRRYDKPVADMFSLDGYYTTKAYYIVENKDKKIGDTGSTNFFEGDFKLELYPSESVMLTYSLDSFFPNDSSVSFESSDENIVTVDQYGNVTAQSEGFASVSVKVLLDDSSTYYSETVSVEVKDPYVTTGASLTHYYGNGGLVDIPEDLSLREIGSFAFSNFEYVMKTEEELAFDDAETSKAWFIGDSTITKVIIPEGVEKISNYAFANLTALEEVVLPSTLEHIDYGAFYGCTSLKKISFSSEDNLKIINQNAFENCDLKDTLELKSVCVISDYAFAGNQKLKGLKLPESLISVGGYAFAGCKKLEEVEIKAPKVKYGPYAFTGCKSLTEFEVNSSVLPEGMFYECKDLKAVTIGEDVNDIGVFAFRDTSVSEFKVNSGNKNFKSTGDCVISSDGKTLVAVSPKISGEFTSANISDKKIEAIYKGAFSHNQKLTSVVLEDVTEVGDYALASNTGLKSVKLGKLKEIGEYAFFESAITSTPEFDEKVNIGKYAFSFTKLKEVNVPDKTTIEEGTFSECSDLDKVTIGADCEIGDYAFSLNKDIAFKVVKDESFGKKLFRYEFVSSLKEITIGDNAVIGESAFSNASACEKVALGEGAEIGKMAFYNMSSLKSIDLSKAKSLGDYAISGDVYYMCLDEDMTIADVTEDGFYRYTYHGPLVEKLDVSSAKSIGEYTFSYCRELKDVVLGEDIEEIPQYAFAGCASIKNINLENVKSIGEYAFMECGFEKLSMENCETIGQYAFVSNKELKELTLSEKTESIGEAAFSYCEPLDTVINLDKVKSIDNYGFAYTAITDINLTSAETLGKNVFLKEELTEVTVTLGDDLEKIADNPFAMCKVEPFVSTEDEAECYTFEINDNLKVFDGSLYCINDGGLELITFAGTDIEDVTVAEDTTRISAYAFAESDVKRVKLPFTTTSIGHKAFFGCDNLEMVMFASYYVPQFEEEFDPTYYQEFENIPGTGDYGTYTDYNGNEVQIFGTGLLPYYMWNATAELYSNVFYGANFVDYVGRVEDKLIMVRPVNGQGYDSFICSQYFGLTIDGPQAPDESAVAAIDLIKAIPERVTFDDKALVDSAREAYEKIPTIGQKALVINYSDLVSAEQRIKALDPANAENKDEPAEDKSKESSGSLGFIIVLGALLVLLGALLVICKVFKDKVKKILKPVYTKLAPVINKIKPFLMKTARFIKRLWAKALSAVKKLFSKKEAEVKEEDINEE